MDLGVILLKGVVGGVLVVLFALVGELVRPRSLAGITSGAPSVAAAGLLVTLLTSGVAMAWDLSGDDRRGRCVGVLVLRRS